MGPHADDDHTVAKPIVEMMRLSCDYMEMDFVGQVLVTVGNRGAVADHPQALEQAREIGRQAALSR